MKTFKRMRLFLAVVSLMILFSGFNTGHGATVTVTSPNGGEFWVAGTANVITWTSDTVGNLRITLLKGGLHYALIAGNVPNTGTFNWMIPAGMISGTDFTVKVASCIAPAVSDVSDASFAITGGAGSVIAVTAPNGGETWTAGTTNTISWTSDVTGNVKIVLLKNGVQCAYIASVMASSGTYNWAIPAGLAQGTAYTVKISSVANPLISDVSDAAFTINAGGGTTVTLTSPNGGETWTAGTSNTIAWTSDITGNLRIVLLKGGVQYALIAAMLPNTGSFNWMVPPFVLSGTDYTVKISSCTNPLISDASDADFTINGGTGTSLALTAPNGGETYASGTACAITWTSDISGYVRIVLLKNGIQFAPIGSAIAISGTFNWNIPAGMPTGTDYTVKITSCINPLISDVSDASFTINGPGGSTIAVTAPNGGETWTAGTVNVVTWTSDVAGNVRISLLKNGNPYSLIAASVPNTGSFNWLIPAGLLPGSDYSVKICSALLPLLSDVSDANFSITAGGGSTMTVTAPNGGESWTVGTANTITWTSDIVGNVRIVLLKAGIQVRLIVAGTPNDGSHSWLIPANVLPGTDYRIRISSCLNAAISDVSDLDFAVVPADNATPWTSENSTVMSSIAAGELTSPNLKIYPNPATDKLNIVADRSMTSVRILNSAGQTVLATNPASDQLTVSLGEFNTGIYFVRIETEGTTTTHKIIVK